VVLTETLEVTEPAEEVLEAPPPALQRPHRLGVVVFLAGAASLGTEMAASRLLAPYFGSSNVVWANVIGLMLAFLALGYWLGGRLADRHPSPRVLASVLVAAAALLAATPFAARPLLHAALDGFASISVAVVAGSFFSVLALFALPVTLLGMVSPFAVRLSLGDVHEAGRTSGRLYALSTVGSILGTFAAALVAIPLLGTQRTLLATAAVVALAAAPLAPKALAPAILLGAALALPPGAIKRGADVLYEHESPYQYLRVVSYPNGQRALELNEGVAEQSVWYRHTVLTGGYWDLFLLVPPLASRPVRQMLVIGDGGGTIPRAYARFYPRVRIDGVELDPSVTAAARRYLGLGDNPRLHTVTADGRVYLERSRQKFDLIVIDAYRQPYVPFQLATREFFRLVREHLAPGGIVALNVAATPHDRRLTERIGTTLATSFPQVWRISALRFNDVVLGVDRPWTRAGLRARLAGVAPPLRQLLPRVDHNLHRVVPRGSPWTDDHAPVEWLTDRMLAEQVSRGQGLDETLLPTAPAVHLP
jgi:spermidine synthase